MSQAKLPVQCGAQTAIYSYKFCNILRVTGDFQVFQPKTLTQLKSQITKQSYITGYRLALDMV